MGLCNYYHLECKTYNDFVNSNGGPLYSTCWGTRECEECFCDGDRLKCDFYPEVREEARRKIEKLTEWIGKEGSTILTCKNCGWEHDFPIPRNYCPNCGYKAK